MDALQVAAEPRRRRLLDLCAEERTVGELHAAMPDVTLGAVSQHLARLRDAGLVTVRVDGRRRWYRADRGAIDAMWTGALDRLSALAR